MAHVIRGYSSLCGRCHRVRRADGRWAVASEFVTATTEARVTHGICPTCTIRVFGAIDDGPAVDVGHTA
jgi:hypothetical protein